MAYDFDTIARTYDRLNRVMTFGLDRRWRRLGAQAASPANQCGRAAVGRADGTPRTPRVLDVACGTGDMVLELAKRGYEVTGVDISEEMLAIAKVKGERLKVKVEKADAEHLPFPNDSFDAVTCAFGVRNFVHLEQGLNEMLRVLKPGGKMVILELATPDSKLLRPFYNFYTRRIIPWFGSRIAGNREAYTYLPESIEKFPKGGAFLDIIHHSSLNIQHCRHRRLSFGVCRMYVVEK